MSIKSSRKMQYLRVYSVLFLNLYFLKTEMRMKMVFCSFCISNFGMRLVSFFFILYFKIKNSNMSSVDKMENH